MQIFAFLLSVAEALFTIFTHASSTDSQSSIRLVDINRRLDMMDYRLLKNLLFLEDDDVGSPDAITNNSFLKK